MLRNQIKDDISSFKHLDAVQLIKHALGFGQQCNAGRDTPESSPFFFISMLNRWLGRMGVPYQMPTVCGIALKLSNSPA